MDKKKYILIFAIPVLIIGGGIFAWQYFNTSETADWKTYKNEQYGFEIKYPEDWYYGDNNYENQQMICFNPEGLAGDCTAILTISWNTKLQERYAAMKQLFEKDYTVTESVVSIAGAEGKLLTIGNTPGFTKSLFFEKNGYVYNFAMREVGYETLFDPMLSTFRFIGEQRIQTGKINIDNNQIAELQKAVDGGSQPWRLDSKLIVSASILQYGFITEDLETIKQISLATSAGVAEYEITHQNIKYIVTVIKPTLGENKIWTISDIELEK